MSDFKIEFPPGYEDYAWEVESKGWLQGVTATIAGRRYRLTFYEPTSLAQDVRNELATSTMFFEPNLLVVPETTRDCMTAAIADLARTGAFRFLLPEDVGSV
jgi:hypothetical protein